jgi:hypothetical protein
MILHHSLAVELAALLAWNSAPARPNVVGVVVEANRVHLNAGAVSAGATSMTATVSQLKRGACCSCAVAQSPWSWPRKAK